MGLDFNHSEVCWSYSGFNTFRRKLALEIGIVLGNMQGFRNDAAIPSKSVWGTISWDTVTDDIKDLLNHSDCDGNLTSEQCRVIAPRLIELVSNWDDEDWDKRKALELAEDMKWCHKNNKTLEFI